MKTTCNGCKACQSHPWGSSITYYCSLGYQTRTVDKIPEIGLREQVPMEDCPKPKTNKEYLGLEEKRF